MNAIELAVQKSKIPRRYHSILLTIVSFSPKGSGDDIFPSVKTIAERCRFKVDQDGHPTKGAIRAVQVALNWLVNNELITLRLDSDRRGGRDSRRYESKGRTAEYQFTIDNQNRLATFSDTPKAPARGKDVPPKSVSLPTREDGTLDERRMTPTLWSRVAKLNPVPGYGVRPDLFLANTPYPGTEEPRTRVRENPVPGYGQGTTPSEGASEPPVLRLPSEHCGTEAFGGRQHPVHAVENSAADSPNLPAEGSHSQMRPIDHLTHIARQQMLLVNELRPVDQSDLANRLRSFARARSLDSSHVDQVAAVVFVELTAANSLAKSIFGHEAGEADEQGRIRDDTQTTDPPEAKVRPSRVGFHRLARFAGELLAERPGEALDRLTFVENLKCWCAREGIDYSDGLVHRVADSELWKRDHRLGRYR